MAFQTRLQQLKNHRSNYLMMYHNEYFWPSIEQSFGQWPNRSQPTVDSFADYNLWNTSFWDNLIRNPTLLYSSDENNNSVISASDAKNENWFIDHMVCEMCPNLDIIGFSWKNNKLLPPVGTPMVSTKKPVSPHSSPVLNRFSDDPFNDSNQLNDQCVINCADNSVEMMSSQMADMWIPQTKSRRRQPSLMECVFCKNNNERPEFYKSHILKDPDSNIQCPVLRAYNCPICNNGGGPKAHTIRYCPLNKAGLQAKIERFIMNQSTKMENQLKEVPKKSDVRRNRKSRKRDKSQ